MSLNETPLRKDITMDRNVKIVLAATTAITVISGTAFAVAGKVRRMREQKADELAFNVTDIKENVNV